MTDPEHDPEHDDATVEADSVEGADDAEGDSALYALHLPVKITSVIIEDHRSPGVPIRLLPDGAELRID